MHQGRHIVLRLDDFSIYFVCPDQDVPVGGIKVIYQHVDMLVAAGAQAYVLHNTPGFRCTWFDNETPVKYSAGHFIPTKHDIFVLPEVIDPEIHTVLAGYHKVILNQNCYYTFENLSPSSDHQSSPYLDPTLLGCITVSEDSLHYLSYAFPKLNLFRVRNRIDSTSLAYRAEKKNQIAYMPRKNAPDSTQVFQMLRHRGALEGYEVIAIDGVSAERAAELIAESKFFFSFGSPEGFSLPPAEAMATGSVVVGYHGWGGSEFLINGLAFPIETSDVITFSRRAEQVLLQHRTNASSFDSLCKKASQFIHSHYDQEQQEHELHSVWSALVSLHAQRIHDAQVTHRNSVAAHMGTPAVQHAISA